MRDSSLLLLWRAPVLPVLTAMWLPRLGNLARETCIHNRLPRSVSVVPICPMIAGVHPLLGSVP